MSNKLKQFLTEIAKNPESMAEYFCDPTNSMRSAGLSAEEQDILLNANSERVSEILNADQPQIHSVVFVVVVIGIAAAQSTQKSEVVGSSSGSPVSVTPAITIPGGLSITITLHPNTFIPTPSSGEIPAFSIPIQALATPQAPTEPSSTSTVTESKE